MKYFLIILIFTFQFVFTQSFTGGLKIATQYTDYDNNSIVLGDSIVDENYSVSTEVPGLREFISFNAFGTIANGNTSLILEMTNDDWTSLIDYPEQNIRRFTLDWSNEKFLLTLGDFYKNGIDVFIASRSIRGLRLGSNQNSDFRYEIYGGEFEKPVNFLQPLPQQYNYFETGGIFQRMGGAAEVTKNWNENIETKIQGIYAKDLENSIDESTVKPLENIVIGGTINSFHFDGKLSFGGGFWYSKLDSLSYLTIQEKSIIGEEDNPESSLDSLKRTSGDDHTFKFWINYNDEKVRADFQIYRMGTNYYTAGNPYLLTDRIGGIFSGFYDFNNWFSANLETEYFINNLDDNKLYPHSNTFRVVPFLIFKYGQLEFGVGYPWQTEISDTTFQESVPTFFDRTTKGPEIEINYNTGKISVNYSGYFSQVSEKSIIYGDTLFSSSQMIHNFNIFFNTDRYFMSLGSALSFFDGEGYTSGFNNYGVYGNIRYQLIPMKFVFEGNLTWQVSKVDHINIWEKIGDYEDIIGGAYLEYFLNSNFSFKAGVEYVDRDYSYTKDDVEQILSIPGFDYTYFAGQEDVQIVRPLIEINILF